MLNSLKRVLYLGNISKGVAVDQGPSENVEAALNNSVI